MNFLLCCVLLGLLLCLVGCLISDAPTGREDLGGFHFGGDQE